MLLRSAINAPFVPIIVAFDLNPHAAEVVKEHRLHLGRVRKQQCQAVLPEIAPSLPAAAIIVLRQIGISIEAAQHRLEPHPRQPVVEPRIGCRKSHLADTIVPIDFCRLKRPCHANRTSCPASPPFDARRIAIYPFEEYKARGGPAFQFDFAEAESAQAFLALEILQRSGRTRLPPPDRGGCRKASTVTEKTLLRRPDRGGGASLRPETEHGIGRCVNLMSTLVKGHGRTRRDAMPVQPHTIQKRCHMPMVPHIIR